MISEFDKGWFIGVLEGEGTFGFYNGSTRVAVEMSDEDTVVRIAEIFGMICGKVFVVREREKHHRVHQENWTTLYRLQVTGDNAKAVMRYIVPYMSTRRRQKIWQSLNGYRPPEATLKASDLLKLVVNK